MPSKNVSSKRKTSTKKNKSMKGGWKYNKKINSLMSRKRGGRCGCNSFFNGGGFGDNVTDAKNVVPLNNYSGDDPSRHVSTEHTGMTGGRRKRSKRGGGIIGYGPNDAISNMGIVPNMNGTANGILSTMGLVNPAAYSQMNTKISSIV